MILSLEQVSDHSYLGLWKIEESPEQLEGLVDPSELERVKDFHPEKKLEQYASRIVLEKLCNQFQIPFHGIYKDEHGKPFLKNSEAHISITHSFPFVAALINTKEACGIDIEQPRTQLIRISHKFLSDSEKLICQDDLEKLCLCWSAKESLYKLYGRKRLSFKTNLMIREISADKLETTLHEDTQSKPITLHHRKVETHTLVYSI